MLQTATLTGSIVDRDRNNGVFSQSPRESKLSIETRTPTAFGEARTLFEFDWAGSNQFNITGSPTTTAGGIVNLSDSLVPRLRYAYGTLGGFLGGLAYNSNFADPDGNGETIDFGGNVGEPGRVRVPQVRYTQPLAPWGLLGAVSVSAETPETTMNTPAGTISSDSPSSSLPTGPGLPGALGGVCNGAATVVGPRMFGSDLRCWPAIRPRPARRTSATACYIPQPWGHFDVAFVVRPDLEVNDGRFVNKQFVGYGGHVSCSGKSWRWHRPGQGRHHRTCRYDQEHRKLPERHHQARSWSPATWATARSSAAITPRRQRRRAPYRCSTGQCGQSVIVKTVRECTARSATSIGGPTTSARTSTPA